MDSWLSSVCDSNCSPLLLARLRSIKRAVRVAPTMAPPRAVMMIQIHQKVWPGPRLGLSSVVFAMLSAGKVSNADEANLDDGSSSSGSSTTEHAVSGVRSRSEGHDPAPGSDRGLTIHAESDWTDANAELSRQFPWGQSDVVSHLSLIHI